MIMNLTEQLKEHEGFRGVPYLCTSGKTTIGYGRNLDANPITESEAELLLVNDIKNIQSAVKRAIKLDGHNGPRQAVIINMAFNIGITGLLRFKKMLSAFDKHLYSVAAHEMLNSKWARQVGARAEQLALQMQSGEWS
ncbi:glycoside hydrolase family protein [Psychrosphaera sp. 1_MG-2023]|uniref:glycoside hydrolase family protein n=1 Tax=Psychrosphaera sp. 1_MG-2023 TaxID=3062643 RepID=UPI0026E29D34|nr:glycoside hydrolase family protein [Psychrosphaera sp. 1_MG-2023]MDO6718828.1 glycoside hydrolase family protein [Psychrosphaera sp. 1_MG-2023]